MALVLPTHDARPHKTGANEVIMNNCHEFQMNAAVITIMLPTLAIRSY